MVIRFFEQGQLIAEHSLSPYMEVIDIGRHGGNGIGFSESTVSAKHAQLLHRNGKFYLKDNHSSNGSFVNNRRLQPGEEVLLTAGMVFHFASPAAQGVVFAESKSTASQNAASLRAALDKRSPLRIGRNPDNDMVLPADQVSRSHAIARRENSRYFIKDLGSKNGSFVNGKKIHGEVEIFEKDVILIGTTRLTLGSAPIDIRRETAIRIAGLEKVFPGGRQGFYPVSLSISAQSVCGIMGPSGCGKSTLLNVLTGNLASSQGIAYIHGLELRSNIHYLKHYMGYVPQYDIVHKELSVHDALWYTARLRIEGIDAASFAEKALGILGRLRIEDLLHQRIDSLSGGQRKRVCIALELINDPLVLFLDEPTSPLDPQSAQELIIILQDLAKQGTTVVLVTHKPEDIPYLREVLFLGREGYPMYYGAAANHKAWFEVTNTVDIYSILNAPRTPRFETIRTRYQQSNLPGMVEAQPSADSEVLSKKYFSPLSQFWWLLTRSLRIKINDWSTSLLLVAQAPVIALLICAIFPQITMQVLFLLAISSIWLGVNNAGREIVSEADIYRRERMYNLGIGTYVGSKITLFFLLGIVQTAFTTVIVSIAYDGKLVSFDSSPQLFTALLALNLVASLMGLLVSAMSSTNERVVSIIPLLLIPQILLAGVLTRVETKFVEGVSYLTLSRWGTEMLTGVQKNVSAPPPAFPPGAPPVEDTLVNANEALISQYHPSYYDKSIFGNLTGKTELDALALSALSFSMLLGIWVAMRRKDAV